MDILAKLFGSPSRVKLMRLFLMNPEDVFDMPEVSKRSKVPSAQLRKEIKLLADVGLIKQRIIVKMIPKRGGKEGALDKKKVNGIKQRIIVKMIPKRGGKEGALDKKKVNGYGMDPSFPYLSALRSLVTEIALGKEDVAARFRNCGQMKLIIVSGIFLDESNSRVDILLVGDKLKRPIIEGVLRRLEAELGKELTYGILESAEFDYRYGIYDKFIRDILDYPHLVVLNKLNLF